MFQHYCIYLLYLNKTILILRHILYKISLYPFHNKYLYNYYNKYKKFILVFACICHFVYLNLLVKIKFKFKFNESSTHNIVINNSLPFLWERTSPLSRALKYSSAICTTVKKQKRNFIKCTTLLPPFFSEIRGFIVKNWLYIYDSKYCPSLAITFSHLSGSVRIPRRKNWSSFEAVHESIQFFTSS